MVGFEEVVSEATLLFVLHACWHQAAAVAAGLSDIVPMKVRHFVVGVFVLVACCDISLGLIGWWTFRTAQR